MRLQGTKREMAKIGICIPSRGLIFAESIRALERERKGYDTKLYISTSLPIPAGHNLVVNDALRDGSEYILFIEEDVAIPAGAFERLLASQADIACIDYGVSGWSCITKSQTGEILWCGLGCTLIHRSVFEALKEPFFRADMTLLLPEFRWKQLPAEYVEKRNYGNLDIWFFSKAREAGFEIKQVEGECRHLELISLGQRGINNGIHIIKEKPGISNHQVLNTEGG